MKFYKKELLSNRLALPNGHSVKFERVGDSDTGMLATEDAGLIAELDKAAAAGRGGVIPLTEQQFQELKKNPPAAPSRMRSLNAQAVRQLLASQNRANGAAPAAAAVKREPSAPMEVPKGIVTISTRRKLRELGEAKAIAIPKAPAKESAVTA